MFHRVMLSCLLFSALPVMACQEPDGEIELMLHDCFQGVKGSFNQVAERGYAIGKNSINYISQISSGMLNDESYNLIRFEDNIVKFGNELSHGVAKAISDHKVFTSEGSVFFQDDAMSLDSYVDSNIGATVATTRDNVLAALGNSVKTVEGKNLNLDGYDDNASLDMYVDSNSWISNKFDSCKKLFVDQDSVVFENATVQPSWYSKIWNADIAGYQGAGKYVVAGSAVVTAALLVGYYAGFFSKKSVSLEDQVEALIEKAQNNPNIIITELPKILDICDNDEVRFDVIKIVLSSVEITPEIEASFGF